MRLNQQVRYGSACLFEMSKSPGEYLEAEHLSIKYKIPPAYTQKILQRLVRAGLITSLKGRGYKLARPLSEINVIELLQALRVPGNLERINTNAGVLLENRVSSVLSELRLSQILAVGKGL